MEKSNSRMMNDLKNSSSSSLDCYQVTLQLKEILDKDYSIEEFAKWLGYLLDMLTKYNVSMSDYVHRVHFIIYEEEYSSKFFRYCFRLQEMKQYLRSFRALKIPTEAETLLQTNILGPICFVTPELGRWSTVGGLGVMVDELTQGLASIGQDVIVISPYYHQNRKGETDYLSRDPIKIEYIRNIDVHLDQNYSFGVHHGVGNGGIRYFFLHNFKIFPVPYPEGSVSDCLRNICLMGKGVLQFLCDFRIIPALIVTNDWFTGLTAAYSKNGCFGETFKGTTFFHICHNLESTYEGRLYPSKAENTLDHIHQLPSDWLVDYLWKQIVINPSRCAIKLSDQWGTVSNSYKRDLMDSSPLAALLNSHPQPFGFPNGIFKEKRMKALQEKAGSNRDEAKKILQTKYFGYGDADLNVPIYSFVGRITQQKGVLLILDAVEQLVQKTSGKINILVGGMGNPKDPYCATCINKINYLRSKYPYAFWANPFEFFTDGPLVNLGSDFGLMPSLFEPGGIVQHEYFIAGTPVIAFRTGGLKDTVFEFEWDSNKGNGITFDSHNYHEFYNAVERSLNLFANKEKLDRCRKNAFNSAIDVAEVSRAWCREFCRLRGKIFFNVKDVYESKNEPIDKEAITRIDEIGSDYCFNRKEMEESFEMQNDSINKNAFNPGATSVIIDGEIHIPATFTYPSNENKKPSSVQICGSFDKWQVRHPLAFDPIKTQWTVTLKFKKGKYCYKYIVDGEWVLNPEEASCMDNDGMINNCINL